MSYLTVAGEQQVNLVVMRSVFIARARETADEAEARSLLNAAKESEPKADHYCYAWRIIASPQDKTYYNDGGEPSGSAGRPILNAILAAGVTNTAVVVARYFGGKKLGLPGLAEAYSRAAQMALAAAGTARRVPSCLLRLRLDYALLDQVRWLAVRNEAEEIEVRYAATVDLALKVPLARKDQLAEALAALGLKPRLEQA